MTRDYVLDDDALWEEQERVEQAGGVMCGIDEAGRGALAGPVVAAAVVLLDSNIKGLADSKQLTPRRREALFEQLQTFAFVGVGIVGPEVVDRINILQANFLAMQHALYDLRSKLAPSLRLESILVDGDYLTEPLRADAHACHARMHAIIKGDAKVAEVSAASIVAKVTRDRLMTELDTKHPGYGFAGHSGYPSPSHLAALKELGPSPVHRQTFAPVVAARRPAVVA